METPHIEGGLLDADNDEDVDLTIDPSALVFVGDPAPVIAAIAQGGGLSLQQAKDAVAQAMPVLSAISIAFPPAAPFLTALTPVLKAIK